MKIKSISLLAGILLITGIVSAQEKYKGTLFTKLGDEIHGEISMNLKGENDYLIPITTVEKSKSKSKKLELTTTTRLNVAIINKIEINGLTYYTRDIKIGYDDKELKNVCVQLIHGSLTSGIFQSGTGTDMHSIA